MRVGTLVGIILIVAGAAALIFGGISYTKRRETVRLVALVIAMRRAR
jgi:hypothetical protein